MIKIGIVGSRNRADSEDWNAILDAMDRVLKKWRDVGPHDRFNYGDIHIISGGNRNGIDRFAEEIAMGNGYPITIFHAMWEVLGKKAGPIRNELIAKVSDVLIAAPAPDSKGTVDCINKFKKYHPEGELIIV